MKLSNLLQFDNITIQMHDNPDPDAIASAYGLYRYFHKNAKKVRIVYGGRAPVAKANLVLLMQKMADATFTYMSASDAKTPIDGLLLTVDCQYGEGNVTKLSADAVAIIDHHVAPNKPAYDPTYTIIQSQLAGCATLIWKLLTDENYALEEDKVLSTALYYGLMTDSGNFTEVHHPLDRDMMDSLIIDKTFVYRLCNSNISLDELKIAGVALMEHKYDDKRKCTIIKAAPCDPNILGFIADLALQVDVVNVCVVYNELADGYKFSVRSCVKEVHANDLAAFLSDKIGSGGGHIDKSGGFISRTALQAVTPAQSLDAYIDARLADYFDRTLIIDTKDYDPDMSLMRKYRKLPVVVGFADPMDFLKIGDDVLIRSLEGDFELTVDSTFYIMIGIMGEVYPMKKDKFHASYEISDNRYLCETEYQPTARRADDGASFDLTDYAKSCRPIGTSFIYARPTDSLTKIFTAWDEDNYMLGHAGDYIACREDDCHDLYIIEKSIFAKTYELA